MDNATAIQVLCKTDTIQDLRETAALQVLCKTNQIGSGLFSNTSEIRGALDVLGIKNDSFEDDHVSVMGLNYVDLAHLLGVKLSWSENAPSVKMIKTTPNAIVPSKVHGSDVGYDLTIISKVKDMVPSGAVVMYDTGIQARVPWGHYLEILPRSSLSKTGWMLANSVGVIDPSYTGNLLVVVARVDPEAPPLPLPFRGFQLVVRKQLHMNITEIDVTTDTANTARGAGGFGSTS